MILKSKAQKKRREQRCFKKADDGQSLILTCYIDLNATNIFIIAKITAFTIGVFVFSIMMSCWMKE
ncbi:hypothetical protein [Enterococcus lactis]|uniref:hypothetical protein n=1 Tax=Enterococcus lactis TaxID=357441 RepID=UPI0037703450